MGSSRLADADGTRRVYLDPDDEPARGEFLRVFGQTNIGVSLGENVAVAGVVSLAATYPIQAAIVAGVILVIGFVVLWFAFSRIKKGWRALRRWMARDIAPGTA